MKKKQIVPLEVITKRIFIIRGYKVMVDADLAELYQVPTKRLNEQVRRNRGRFPKDFMFQLSEKERSEVVANCDHLSGLRFSHQLPYAFTEHGVAMLSSVLRSDRAVQMSIYIVRAFIKLRELLYSNKELAHRVEELEGQIMEIAEVLNQLVDDPIEPKEKIGFKYP